MAETFDATARLAEGRPAVDNIQDYVWACHVLGYADPDLTLHTSQVRDWYGSEDGLDLRALHADSAALEAAVAATEDALTRQNDQLGALPTAWQGRSADLSGDFLRRHGEVSAAAAAAVRTAAEALATLRDNLWRTVDGKVAAAIAVDERAPDEWLAAAHTVTTGAGDRAAASERIDQEVKPFVDNDIRADWLTAMRSAMASVTEAYESATAELTAEPDAVFEVPGELGPSWTPPPSDGEVATVPAAAAAVAPSAPAPPSWSEPAAVPMGAPSSSPPPPMPLSPAAPFDPGAPAPAMAAPPPAPSLGGMPDVGSGLSGFGQQLADAFGSLLGSADEGLANPNIDDPDIDDPELDEDELDDELDDGTDEDEDEPVDPAADPEEELAAGEPVEEAVEPAGTCDPAEAPVEPPPPEEPVPTPVPPPPEPGPPPEPAAAETPCEIAADELPQVGQ